MVTVKIDESILLDMLMERVEYWTDCSETRELFEDYYRNLISSGCLDGYELDIYDIVDNDYINNFDVISKEDFEEYGIEDEEDDRIEIANEEYDLYLIRTY